MQKFHFIFSNPDVLYLYVHSLFLFNKLFQLKSCNLPILAPSNVFSFLLHINTETKCSCSVFLMITESSAYVIFSPLFDFTVNFSGLFVILEFAVDGPSPRASCSVIAIISGKDVLLPGSFLSARPKFRKCSALTLSGFQI